MELFFKCGFMALLEFKTIHHNTDTTFLHQGRLGPFKKLFFFISNKDSY